MTSRNYSTPTVAPEWASSRETHMAVAVAIHAIADDKRSAEDIWAAPTLVEDQHVIMAVEEYVSAGDFQAEPDGVYQWGESSIRLRMEG